MDKAKPKVGIITYHSAFNFGSVLQTYGTVRTIEKLGYSVETIDYQTPSQKLWYRTDCALKKWKETIVNYGFLFKHKARRERAKKFCDFISNYLNITEREYSSYDEIKKADELNYEILISGSDQVWNINCGEFRYEPFEAILPYFLQFGNPRKRIAYASSFAKKNLDYILKVKPYLDQYDFLSTREPMMKKVMDEGLERKTELVCDPTWLLTKEEWLKLPGIYKPKTASPYIFVYVLGWSRADIGDWLNVVKQMAKNREMDVICISPLTYYSDRNVKMIHNAGPLDFLSYIANASLVITNTFHGTIFSINFEKPFFSINARPDSRQGQMLEMTRLTGRSIMSTEALVGAKKWDMDFGRSTEILNEFRKKSIDYLKHALND